MSKSSHDPGRDSSPSHVFSGDECLMRNAVDGVPYHHQQQIVDMFLSIPRRGGRTWLVNYLLKLDSLGE